MAVRDFSKNHYTLFKIVFFNQLETQLVLQGSHPDIHVCGRK